MTDDVRVSYPLPGWVQLNGNGGGYLMPILFVHDAAQVLFRINVDWRARRYTGLGSSWFPCGVPTV